jgi:maleate isomerase
LPNPAPNLANPITSIPPKPTRFQRFQPFSRATIEAEGIAVTNSHSLEIPDNLAVGRRDPALALAACGQLDLTGADALVLSACVQMPSATAIDAAEQKYGLPVVSAASCTVRQMLLTLGLEPVAPGFGTALAPRKLA